MDKSRTAPRRVIRKELVRIMEEELMIITLCLLIRLPLEDIITTCRIFELQGSHA